MEQTHIETNTEQVPHILVHDMFNICSIDVQCLIEHLLNK